MKTIKDAKELFEVKINRKSTITRGGIPDPDIIEISLITKEDLDYYNEYSSKYGFSSMEILESKPVGRLWPNSTTVTITDSYSRNCYSRQYYQIKSELPLTQYDIDTLKAQGCFMRGQVCGEVNLNKVEMIDGKYCYFAHSICDSGD